ncbi:MAG: TIGR02117 family protein [Methylococcaceae bacterium]|nr:MAG: TIGR02117 family protein [Methylococcaceae bacterium]
MTALLKWLYLTLLLTYLLAGCSSLPEAIEPGNSAQPCSGSDEIYVLNHGWHTGIAVKADDLNPLINGLSARFPQNAYYEIGWGDAGFYQANTITAGLTFRAMFWSPGTVLHVVGFDEAPARYFSNSDVRTVKVSQDGYRNLLKFIHSSFMMDDAGNIMPQQPGIYGDSQFYSGVGTYYIFNTCNTWTAKALYSAGLDVDTRFKLTASSIMGFLGQQHEAETNNCEIY